MTNNMQQDTASQVSPDDDSVFESLDETGDNAASFDYDKVAARQ